jgi:hypothetical protein
LRIKFERAFYNSWTGSPQGICLGIVLTDLKFPPGWPDFDWLCGICGFSIHFFEEELLWLARRLRVDSK